MKINTENLPFDIKLLHQIINDLMDKVQNLEEQLALLKAKRYGKSSEKINKQIEDIELSIEENESLAILSAALEAGKSEFSSEKFTEENPEKKVPKRQNLPSHLERDNVVLDPVSICPSCGGEEFRKLNDDVSETLEYVPSSFRVKRYIRPRCACINCEKIVQADVASKTIDKGMAESGLLAHILVQKYCNHLPLYRQSQMYEREGIKLSRSTMAGWVGQCSTLLEPLINELRRQIFASSYIHGDDTPIKVLAPELKRTKVARLWVYVRDGRPYGDETPPAVCYFYSPDRKGVRPLEHLKDFKGVFHADAYGGYDKLYKDKNNLQKEINEAACWAHTRRKFYEVVVASDNANIAVKVLEYIGEIYRIESDIRGLEPGLRLERRQAESKLLVEKLFEFFKKSYSILPKKSRTAQSIAYALNNEYALMLFLGDGKIEIDNNAAERAVRGVAIGRKNWLFAGSDQGGASAANIYSLIETAKLNDINPWQYLQKVLELIQDHSLNKIAELLPWNIKLEPVIPNGSSLNRLEKLASEVQIVQKLNSETRLEDGA
jgi:transposase